MSRPFAIFYVFVSINFRLLPNDLAWCRTPRFLGSMSNKESVMGIKTWDKVTLRWDCYGMGLCTSVRLDGEFKPRDPYNRYNHETEDQYHGLFLMEATSLSRERDDGQRKGEIILDIRRKTGPNIAPNAKAVVEFLDARLSPRSSRRPLNEYGVSVQPPATISWIDTKFTLSFVLANNEQFCDTVIEIGRGVFEALGINDESGIYLAGFSLKRESFVMIDGSWITFVRWLRISHRLPILGVGELSPSE